MDETWVHHFPPETKSQNDVLKGNNQLQREVAVFNALTVGLSPFAVQLQRRQREFQVLARSPYQFLGVCLG